MFKGSGPDLVKKLEKLGVEHVSLLTGGLKAVQKSYPFLCDTKSVG
jgi:methylmalonyl-CoA mutase cobalamin-binding subunit